MTIVFSRVRRLFRLLNRSDPVRDIDDELRLHLDLRAEELARSGLPEPTAREQAVQVFGDVPTIRSSMIELARSGQRHRGRREYIGAITRDVKYAVRSLRRAPGVAFAAVVAFALGIGATTTMFSIGHAILADLPVAEPDRLVQLVGIDRRLGSGDLPLRLSELLDVRDQQRTMSGVAGFIDIGLHLGDGKTAATRIRGERVSGGMFSLVGIAPALGREIVPADERPGAPPVIVLSDRVWRERFSSDPSVVGRAVRVNGRSTTVVGVAQPTFEFPALTEAWVPLVGDRVTAATDTAPTYFGIARLRDGFSIDQARGDIARLGDAAVRSRNGHLDREGLSVRPLAEWSVSRNGRIRIHAMIFLVSFVLIIACANVANLLLARTAARSREIAIRTSLGMGRSRLIRSFLMEALLLAAGGGALGLLLAKVGITTFGRAVAFEVGSRYRFEIDWIVAAFAFGLVALSALATTLGPARQASRVAPAEVFRAAAGGRTNYRAGRVSSELVTLQVTLATVLLTVSGLIVVGAVRYVGKTPVRSPAEMVSARVELRPEAYHTTDDQGRFVTAVLDRLEKTPGVASAAIGTATPGLAGPSVAFALAGDTRTPLPITNVSAISPRFFSTFGIAIVAGREFSVADRAGAPRVAIVTQSFVARYVPTGSPLGLQIRIPGPAAPFRPSDVRPEWSTIVGVVTDVDGIEGSDVNASGVFLPVLQVGDERLAIEVRGTASGGELFAAIRRIVFEVDPDVPLFQLMSLPDLYRQATAGARVTTTLFAAFGISALGLASVGLFALVAFSVRRRFRETAIRVALGEKRGSLVYRLARSGAVRVGVGLAVGLTLAYLGAPAFAALMFGADPRDPAVYFLVAATIVAVAVVAILTPARAVLRVAPMDVLRED